jgi:NAD(P)-dependent dehydrogenase (short-subunit alcohol dehydrogenase family)
VSLRARRQWIASGLGQGADASGASIVNIASMVGKNGNLGQANYAASKAGVIGFTKTAAKELARDAVRCNVVLPGFITTPMTAAVPEKVLQRIIPTVPMARMGEAEDIANAALFLASDRSSYMTGAVVEVSGGLNM